MHVFPLARLDQHEQNLIHLGLGCYDRTMTKLPAPFFPENAKSQEMREERLDYALKHAVAALRSIKNTASQAQDTAWETVNGPRVYDALAWKDILDQIGEISVELDETKRILAITAVHDMKLSSRKVGTSLILAPHTAGRWAKAQYGENT